MKKFMTEFKEFINKGNAMDMAVGVIIGGAFTAIVTSLTDSILNPLLKRLTGGSADGISGLTIPVGGGEYIDFSAFIAAIINFILVALIVFCIVKAMNGMRDKVKKKEEEKPAEPVPTCPFCLEEVKAGSTRCPHCGGEFAEPAKAPEPEEPKPEE